MQNDDELIGIEDKFECSWDEVQSLCERDFKPEPAITMRGTLINWKCYHKLVIEMREHGYDLWLRVEPFSTSLLLSRIKTGAFKGGEAAIFLTANANGGLDIRAFLSGRKFEVLDNPFSLRVELKALLDLLMVQPIE
jgi:hypothetical protein